MGNPNKPSSRRSEGECNSFDDYFRGALDGIQPIRPTSEKSPSSFPENAPDYCAFCCDKLEGKQFTAFSKVIPASAICCDCISRFAPINRFVMETFDIWFRGNPDYEPLRKIILKRFFAEKGSVRTKRAVAALAIRLLKTASAHLAGCKDTCPRTGVSLKQVRVALVGGSSRECADLTRVACEQAALPFLEVSHNHLEHGIGFENLAKKTNDEIRWARIGILFCIGYAVPNAECSVVYACDNHKGLPGDVEVIQVE